MDRKDLMKTKECVCEWDRYRRSYQSQGMHVQRNGQEGLANVCLSAIGFGYFFYIYLEV